VDGKNKVGRSQTEWVDNIEDWCRASLQELSDSAQYRTNWNKIVRDASDSNAHD